MLLQVLKIRKSNLHSISVATLFSPFIYIIRALKQVVYIVNSSFFRQVGITDLIENYSEF